MPAPVSTVASVDVSASSAAAADVLARRLAVLVDGAYVSTAHLGPDGPAAESVALAHLLVDAAAGHPKS